MFQEILGRVSGGVDLSTAEMVSAMDQIMQGKCTDEQIGLFLTALHTKGETFEEIAGAARAMRKHMTKLQTRHEIFIDTCGTGGDGSGTFNISTAAALVTAAAGIPVAKHGNRAITSRSGSADVLAELGVNVEASVPQVEACLDELGIGFCFAPLWHQSMRHVAAVRRQLGMPTIFNMLGPLCNPAEAPFQLVGVAKPHMRPLLARALPLLGIRRAFVVNGDDGLDEVTLTGTTHVTEAYGIKVRDLAWTPGIFGLQTDSLESLKVLGPNESAAMIRGILAGEKGPARDIVVLNAAAAIYTVVQFSNSNVTELSCAERAADAIDSGAASQLLADLGRISRR